MSSRMRINVKFGETKVLVPVGEGNITVEELISKAIDKFRKVKKLVSPCSFITLHLCYYRIGTHCDLN